jgi:hypothetical protein
MLDRKMRKMSLQIVDYILVTLHPYPGPNCLKEVIVIELRLSHCLPNYVLSAHFVRAQQKVLLGLNMSIDANKLMQFNVSLVNKNALLTIATFNVSESRTRSVAKVLGVHPRAIGVAKLQRQLVEKEGKELWTLTVCKVRVNVVSTEVRNYLVNWWIIQTKVSPNKKDVTQLKVGPNDCEMKPTHYLMEI